jgi:hypothetical protein
MRKNAKKIIRMLGITLFITMLIMIFEVSPRMAKFILMIDEVVMTRVIEIMLCTTLVLAVTFAKTEKK